MNLGYVTMDTISTGVGRSQVFAYAEALARSELDLTVYSFEPRADPIAEPQSSFEWRRLPMGRQGSVAGAGRVMRAAMTLGRHDVVHARSDMAAAAVMLRHRGPWLWDVRSFWIDQRIALGAVRPGSPVVAAMRRIERGAARRAARIVVLSRAAADVLVERHGAVVRSKIEVIPTCVDLHRFQLARVPPTDVIEIVLSGTMNSFYDISTMVRVCRGLAERHPTRTRLLAPSTSLMPPEIEAVADSREAVAFDAMPAALARSHVGLSICRNDAGVSLKAAVPTKIGELLAVGRPVIVNSGLGDMDAVIAEYACGVVVPDDTEASVNRAVGAVLELIDDSGVAERCRAAAEAHFDLDGAVALLHELYARACDAPG